MHDSHCKCQKYAKEGLIFLQNGNWEKAKLSYEKVLTIHEDSAPSWVNLGICYYQLNDMGKALECYNKALIHNPNNKHALVNKGTVLAKTGELTGAIVYFRKALQVDPQFEMARDNIKRAINDLPKKDKTSSNLFSVIKTEGKYFLEVGNDLLRTPQGNIIESKSPALLEAIISDLADQGEIVVEEGILQSPRCLSAYILASAAIDFEGNWDYLSLNLPEWLESDPIFFPSAGHPIVSIYQEQKSSKVKSFFKSNNIPFKLRDNYDDSEWETVTSFMQQVVSDFLPSQKAALANMAWPHDKQFVSTIIYLIGLCSEMEWAELIFSRSDDICRIIGEQPIGFNTSISNASSEEESQNTVGLIINSLVEEANIVKRYLEISKLI